MIKYMRISTEQMHLATHMLLGTFFLSFFINPEYWSSWMTGGCNTEGWVAWGKIWTLLFHIVTLMAATTASQSAPKPNCRLRNDPLFSLSTEPYQESLWFSIASFFFCNNMSIISIHFLILQRFSGCFLQFPPFDIGAKLSK